MFEKHAWNKGVLWASIPFQGEFNCIIIQLHWPIEAKGVCRLTS